MDRGQRGQEAQGSSRRKSKQELLRWSSQVVDGQRGS